MSFIALALRKPYLACPGQFASLIACSIFTLKGFVHVSNYMFESMLMLFGYLKMAKILKILIIKFKKCNNIFSSWRWIDSFFFPVSTFCVE